MPDYLEEIAKLVPGRRVVTYDQRVQAAPQLPTGTTAPRPTSRTSSRYVSIWALSTFTYSGIRGAVCSRNFMLPPTSAPLRVSSCAVRRPA